MEIPTIPVRISNGNVLASHMVFSGAFPSMTENTIGFNDLISSLSNVCAKDVPILAVDVFGIQKKDIIPELLRRTKTKRELWYMTGIRNAGDVMDAFQGDMSKIIVPYNLTSDTLLREIVEISDSCMPALFAEREEVYSKGNKKKGLRSCVKTLSNMNFRKIIVFDAAGGLAWEDLRDLVDTVIPYAPSAEDAEILRKIGFRDVLVSGVKLFQRASERSEIRSCMLP